MYHNISYDFADDTYILQNAYFEYDIIGNFVV